METVTINEYGNRRLPQSLVFWPTNRRYEIERTPQNFAGRVDAQLSTVDRIIRNISDLRANALADLLRCVLIEPQAALCVIGFHLYSLMSLSDFPDTTRSRYP